MADSFQTSGINERHYVTDDYRVKQESDSYEKKENKDWNILPVTNGMQISL
jgi:hypothetical protein